MALERLQRSTSFFMVCSSQKKCSKKVPYAAKIPSLVMQLRTFPTFCTKDHVWTYTRLSGVIRVVVLKQSLATMYYIASIIASLSPCRPGKMWQKCWSDLTRVHLVRNKPSSSAVTRMDLKNFVLTASHLKPGYSQLSPTFNSKVSRDRADLLIKWLL